MIDIRDYIITNENLRNDSGTLYSPENAHVIENGSNALLKVKEYSKGIIRCENGLHFCIFEDEDAKKISRNFLSIDYLQKAKHYKRKKFFEDFE